MSKAFIASIIQESAQLTGAAATRAASDLMQAIVCPFAHAGQKNVPGSWAEKDPETGRLVGKTFHIVFERGRYDADLQMARYLTQNGYATETPWVPPPSPWDA